MDRVPLPWALPGAKGHSAGTDTSERRTTEEYCTTWAQRHPVLALLAVAPVWSIYSSVAPSIALSKRSVRSGTRGYKFGLLIATTAMHELRRRHATSVMK